MDASRFDQLASQLVGDGSRRRLLRLSASLPLASPLGALLGLDEAGAKKKHKKKHRKPKRNKKKPCTVCASGCSFDSIQDAIDAADPGDTITICAGTYHEDLEIDQNLTLVGAGESAGDTIVLGTGERSVVFIEAGSVTLWNLLLTGGKSGFGGGLVNQGTTELVTCTVRGNTAVLAGGLNKGGGIYNGGTLTLTGCTVRSNTAVFQGGGIYNFGTLILTGTEIRGNGSAHTGGGIYNDSTITFDAASQVTGNEAFDDDGGGGIFNNGGTVTLASSANVTENFPNNCAGDAVAQCNG